MQLKYENTMKKLNILCVFFAKVTNNEVRRLTTLKDIAQHAQVSLATVSRVLNGNGDVSVAPETRERVHAIAEQLQYKARLRRRRINKRRFPEIGVIAYRNPEVENFDTYFLSIRQSVEREFGILGLRNSMSVFWSDCMKSYAQFADVDAVVVIGENPEAADYFMNRKSQVVFIDSSPNPERYDSVVVDFSLVTYKALDHLTLLGHSCIGFVGGQSVGDDPDPREVAFREYMRRKGLLDEKLIQVGAWTISGGYELATDLLKMGAVPSAMFVASDPMALGVIRAIADSGLRVPQDIALVACDDVEMASYMTPALTTVHIPTRTMGRLAVHMLVNGILDETGPLQLVVPSKLVIRESCGAHFAP